MKIEEFDYPLSRERIAQWPLKERDASRLLVVERRSGLIKDARFQTLPEYLSSSDLVVVNNCRVIPGRLQGRRKTGGRVELTLLHPCGKGNGEWECLVRGPRPRKGERVTLGESLEVEFIQALLFDLAAENSHRGGRWQVKLFGPEDIEGPKGLEDALEKHGLTPLPPYIRRTGDEDANLDREGYQTIFARHWGAAACPTAGLHFTERMLDLLRARGVKVVEITLWVSYGTFAPVRVKDVLRHRMHPERFAISRESADAINRTRKSRGRIVAVGTTVTRALEQSSDEEGLVHHGEGETALFIYPGFRFRVVDALVTNFHLPRSTLLMLVMAFGGKNLIREAYEKALDKGYRFLSYGDAMLII
jgi:S-adenosylmethionine:tRNA ribosyltransferase-isomerase